MPQVKLTIKAREDIKEIGRYTGQKWGRAKRIDYLRQLRVRMRDLGEGRITGRPRHDLPGSPWNSHVGRHVIFYHPVADGIEVVRVLYDAMDFPRHFKPN
ncbi:MAG: type II toxin-antitoxin system RelE/ParE family toxin [bacterium]